MNALRFGDPWWTRRQFLKGSTAVVASAYGLSPGLALAAEIPDKYDGSKFKLGAPEPGAKPGGVLRMGIPNRPPISIFISPGPSSISAPWRACLTT
jgi:hypothetical protein